MEGVAAPAAVRADQQASSSSVRARIKRGRTGCFTCRKRRKKCDEEKPKCLGCIRSGYVCEGYPATVRFDESRAKHSTHVPPSPVSDRMTLQAQGFDNCNVATGPPPTAFQDELDLSDIVDWFFDSEIVVNQFDLHQAIPNLNFASPVGDSVVHGCGGDGTSLPMPAAPDSPAPSTPRLSVSRNLPFLIAGVDTREERQYFMHFVNTTSRILTASNDSNNPLLTAVLPRAFEDTMIQKAILCLGASHLIKLQQSPEISMLSGKQRLLKEAEDIQMKRISAIKSPSGGSPPDINSVLSCSLLLCLYEISEGAGDLTWQIRLNLARDCIQEVLDAMHTTDDGNASFPAIDEFLLDFFIYHDILATVTDPTRRPLIPSPTLQSLMPRTPYMIGLDNGLFDLIARVSSIRSVEPRAAMIISALSLWEELDTWKPLDTDEDHVLACSAYISALYAWLYSMIHQEKIDGEPMREVIKRGFEDMCQIQGTRVLPFLLFPTFVLGFYSINDRERNASLSQFDRLCRFSGLGNVNLAKELVKLSWVEYDNCKSGAWDWFSQIEKCGMSVILS